MSLSTLSNDAWGHLHSFLGDHHQIRLYLTGDKALQSVVVRSRRTFFVGDMHSSPLVNNVMIPFATMAGATSFFLIPKYSRTLFDQSIGVNLRVLNLTMKGGTSDAVHDLSRMDKLEALVVWSHNWYGTQATDTHYFRLPPSVTELKTSFDPVQCIVNLQQLANLATLGAGFSCPVQMNKSVESMDGKWPSSLKSLSISIRAKRDQATFADDGSDLVNRTFDHLPPSLHELSFFIASGFYDVYIPVDVIPPTSCPNLLSYSLAGACDARIVDRKSFPPLFTDLHVDRMVLTGDRDPIFDAILSSSITTLDISGIVEDGRPVHYWSVPDSWQNLVVAMLPRLCLESYDSCLWRLVKRGDCERLLSSPLFVHALKKHGWSENFIRLVGRLVNEDGNAIDEVMRTCDHAIVARYLNNPATKHILRSVVDGLFSHVGVTISADSLRQVMSLGRVYTLTLSNSSLTHIDLVDTSTLTNITLNVEICDEARDLFSTKSFGSLSKMEMFVQDIQSYLQLLIDCKHNFPLLEVIYFTSVISGSPMEPRALSLLAKLNLYRSREQLHAGDYFFVYRVSPPLGKALDC
jgi:hypothetical protein